MTSRFDRLQEIFEEARHLSAKGREELVRIRCADDQELAHEVRSMLEHYTEDFLESPEHLIGRGARGLSGGLRAPGRGDGRVSRNQEPDRDSHSVTKR